MSNLLANGSIDDEAALVARYDFETWFARENQLAPTQSQSGGDWQIWLGLAGRGFGKALALDTPIPTATGWTTMGQVVAGDVLFDERGAPCRVLAAHPVQIGRPCFRVRFSDGAEIVADEDHLWLTIDRRTRKAMRRRSAQNNRAGRPQCVQRHGPRVVTTAEIRDTLTDGGERNHAIPCAAPLQCPEARLPVAPYLLGLWLGDGHTAGAEITSADAEVREAFIAAGYGMKPRVYSNAGQASTYSISGGFRVALRAAGVLGDKHIPRHYLRASEAQRRALLAGLMDTDGYCSPATGAAEFCTKNARLARDVRELALSLGLKAVTHEGRATIDGRDCGPKYRVCFQAHERVFGLERKAASQPKRGAQADRAYRRYIIAVEPVASAPVRCITVDSPSRLFLAGDAMIATHNTRMGVEWARAKAEAGLGPGAIVGRTGADVRDVLIEGPSGLLAMSPPWNRPTYEPGKRRVTWPNGVWATTFSAEAPDQLRGPQHNWALCDELAAWSYAEEAWSNLMFGLRLGDHPQVAALTTPRPIPFLKELLKDPDVAITRGRTLDNAMNLAKKSLDYMIKRYGGTRLGRQELEGILLDDLAGALWTQEMLRACVVPPNTTFVKEDFERIAVAIDPSGSEGDGQDEGDAQGIIVAGLLREEKRFVNERGQRAEIIVLVDDTEQRSPGEWAKRTCELYREWQADIIVAEANFGGAMVRHTILMHDNTVPVKVKTASRGKHIRAQPISSLYEQGRVRHAYGLHKLEDEYAQFTGEGYQGGASPNRADAAVWCIDELAGGLINAPRVRRL